jgi:hypothetical protein
MTQAAAGSELDERVPGRRWIVRLDPVGRGSAEVRVSCGRPACAERRLPSAAAGRTAAVAHLKAHLHATPAPRADTYCACRADGCRAHLPDTGRHARTEQPWRCGGPIVLAVITDRAGRWWQALECCSRCAAATPGAQTAATSRPSAPRTAVRPHPGPPSVRTPDRRPPDPRSGGHRRGHAALLRPAGHHPDGMSGAPPRTRTPPRTRAAPPPAGGEDRPTCHSARPATCVPAGRTHRAR